MSSERSTLHDPLYHIRVKGSLDPKWADRFEGFALHATEDGETLLSGPVADQAALQGLLSQLHGLGLPLLLVARIECPCRKSNCPRRARCTECAAYHAASRRLPYCFRPGTRWDKQRAALASAR